MMPRARIPIDVPLKRETLPVVRVTAEQLISLATAMGIDEEGLASVGKQGWSDEAYLDGDSVMRADVHVLLGEVRRLYLLRWAPLASPPHQ